tara:strand:- start:67466 stop:67675 length:210 start_codon:yes stop_codon:yes gene_type:complete
MTHAHVQKCIESGKIDSATKLHVTQECRRVMDTYADEMRRLKLEMLEVEQGISDAKETLEKVADLEVVL